MAQLNSGYPQVAFTHDLLPKIEIERIDRPEGRVYKTPEGNLYRSCTSVVGSLNKAAIDNWRRRVGKDEADRVSTKASMRGTAIHNLCEKYLLNEQNLFSNVMPIHKQDFLKIRPKLDRHVGLIRGIEHQMYSDALRAAGTTDLIAEWDGVLSIIDFKTSKRLKDEAKIQHYFLQGTAYGIMVHERHDLLPTQVVILMAVDGEKDPQVFIKQCKDYERATRRIFS